MEDQRLRLRSELDRIQYGLCERYIRLQPIPFGLGAQITGRIETLVLALAFERKAIFALDDPPYAQLFVPLFQNFDQQTTFEVLIDPVRDQAEKGVYYRPSEISVKAPDISAAIKKRVCERLTWPIDRWIEFEGEIFNWMMVEKQVSNFCTAAQERLGVDRDTLGVHYRRGDKSTETAYVPAKIYNTAIEAVYSDWKFRKLFITSDSPKAKEDLKAPSGVEVIFDASEQRYNNANHRMLFDKPQLAFEETNTAFKNIWLLSQCGAVVGQDNAHFAVLSTASVFAKTGELRGKLLDGKIVENNSGYLTLYYKQKAAARAFLRIIMPWATASSLAKKRNGRGRV